jgi:glycosyltransferase involved in cell wall biosynthesis
MKLSVAMITYNQERFIGQALESVLAQEVNFDYEIVIGEDFSTDGTRAVILDFQRRYPDRIVVLFRKRNPAPCGISRRQLRLAAATIWRFLKGTTIGAAPGSYPHSRHDGRADAAEWPRTAEFFHLRYQGDLTLMNERHRSC